MTTRRRDRPTPQPVALTRFGGRAGDHNDRAMVASGLLADVLGERLGTTVTVVGVAAPALCTTWDVELDVARDDLTAMATHYASLLSQEQVPVTALSRCAVALATLPVLAAHRPDAVVVWFDAHADLNTPAETTTGYLGGLALSGPLGRWDSGLGSGLVSDNVVLVGARDLDPAEQRLIERGVVRAVPVGPGMAADLATMIDGRPVYVHIDCDVLIPGIVPTDYRVPGGMSLDQLHACAAALARSEIVGIEIGELEIDDPASHSDAYEPGRSIVDALEPIMKTLFTTAAD